MQSRFHLINDFSSLKNDFPILKKTNRDKPLVYLDTAASGQKPSSVIEAIQKFYTADYANIHRGVYELSERATVQFEAAREAARRFINANSMEEIIFVRGTTEAINLVAQSLGRTYWQAGDEVIISTMEHHANIVPWYLLSQQMGLVIKVIPINDAGELDLEAYSALFSSRTKLVAINHVSNVLGTLNPVKEIIALAHAENVPVLVDGAQAVSHLPVNVCDLDCDFYAFSSHKLYGPTGIGVLYGKKQWLDQMPPYQGGGAMIETVAFDKVTFAPSPQKFEAGTPNIAGAIGMHAAMEYLNGIGFTAIMEHETKLAQYAHDALTSIKDLRLIGTAQKKLGVFSFVMADIHPHDIGTILDHEGIAIRAGHHCSMPLMQRFNVPATARASLGIYNTESDIDNLIAGLTLARGIFK